MKCTVDGCAKNIRTRTAVYCDMHYQRQRIHGDVHYQQPRPDDSMERFLAKVRKTETCWIWTAFANGGYGRFQFRGAYTNAHRASYILFRGEIPDGYVVDHMCHNPSCVNPDHLRLATTKQNAENRAAANANNKSGIRGVSWVARDKSWRAAVTHNGKRLVRQFKSFEKAAAAALAMRQELFTHSDMDRRAS